VSARTEAKSLIPEGDVAVGHGSDTDAPVVGERTDRAFWINCNLICDSCQNLTRGVGMVTASRERHVCERSSARRLAELLSTLPSARRGAGTEASDGQSDVISVIQLNLAPSDAYNDF
jgi:hypothetical protein